MNHGLTTKVVVYDDLSDSKEREIYTVRKEAFVDRRGWDIPTYDGGEWERDQYDDSSSIYIVVETEEHIQGCVRVRPSLIPNVTRGIVSELSLQEDYFLAKVGNGQVWEASRFALKTTRNSSFVRVDGVDIRTVLLFGEMLNLALQSNISCYEVIVDGLMKKVLSRARWDLDIVHKGRGSKNESVYYGLLGCSEKQYKKMKLLIDKAFGLLV